MTKQRALRRRACAAAAAGLLFAAVAGSPVASADPADPALDFPHFTYVGTAFDKSTLAYNPTNELIFPSVIRAADYFTNPLGTYYLYYAPHERPGGIALAYSDSINGPWTEYQANPLIANTWPPNYGPVSHVSSPHAVWIEGERKLFLYFHGENSITRYATSDDGINFEYGGTAVSRDATTGGETSYARVFEQSVPRLGTRYLMVFMDNPTAALPGPTGPVSRRIRWAVSNDARTWAIQPEPIVTPQGDEGPNASGPFFLRWNGRNLVIFHAADGNMHAVDVGENFDQEVHLGVVHDSMNVNVAPDFGRSAAPTFYFDGRTVHMYYEAGGPPHGDHRPRGRDPCRAGRDPALGLHGRPADTVAAQPRADRRQRPGRPPRRRPRTERLLAGQRGGRRRRGCQWLRRGYPGVDRQATGGTCRQRRRPGLHTHLRRPRRDRTLGRLHCHGDGATRPGWCVTALRLGIDIGGTKTLAALVTPAGEVVGRTQAPTPARRGPAAVLDTAAGLAAQLLGGDRKTTVGVGAAGTIDPATGTVRYATDSLPGWAGTRVAAELGARLDRPVRVDNDVNAAALGETWAGAGRGRQHLLVVAVGTGLGGGLIRSGRVEHGARGAAGEIAHLPVPGAEELRCGCGRYGHLEALASGTGIAAAYARATGERVDGREVAALAETGDDAAREVLTRAGAALGAALAGLVALLDPQAVVVAGGAASALVPHAAAAYAIELLPAWADVPLLPAALGGDAVAIGAARLAMEEHA